MYQFIGISAAIILVFASFHYIADIVRGETKPQRMAWVIFTTLGTISFFGQLAEGATASLWFPLILMVQGYVILGLSLKYGVGGANTIDKISLVLSLAIFVVWWLTNSAALAIIFAVSINTIGKVLVAIKTYHKPYSEYLPTWILATIASVLTAISVGELNWILLLAPVQNGLTVGAVAGIIIYRRKDVGARP